MKHALLVTTAVVTTLGIGLFTPCQPAFADEETELLKKEIKALEARIDQLEKREKTHKKQEASANAYSSPATGTASASGKSIAQRLNIVERNQELAQEDAQAKAATTPKIEIGNGRGFTITSADNQYSVRMSAYGQVQDRTFFDSSTTGPANTFLMRALRPIIEGKMTDYFDGRMMMDFGKGSTTLLDAYANFHPMPGNDIVNLRAGEMKVPVGIERWQGETDLLFTERGQTTNLVPFRDIGAMLYGQLIPDQLEYHLGIVNGATDLQVNTGDTDNNKDLAGRIMAHPLVWSGVHALEGVAVGVAGTYGVHQGTTASGNSDLTAGYVSPGQRSYFTYTPTSGTDFANGVTWRANPQAMYYNGPFSLIGEYVLEEQEITNGTKNAGLRNQAWMGLATYVLTGEDASFTGVKPAHNFNPKAGDWGAFELAARYSQLDIDPKTFPTFANPATSAKKAQEFMGGVNWYFNPAVKINLDAAFTTFDGGNTGNRNRADEKVLMTEGQFKF